MPKPERHEATIEREQKRFDEFRRVYNDERPHEALGQKRPATIYRPSSRPYPETLPPIEYAGHLEVRKLGNNGMMRWKHGKIFTSKTLTGEWVGPEEIDDGILVGLLRAGAAGAVRRTGDEAPWLIVIVAAHRGHDAS